MKSGAPLFRIDRSNLVNAVRSAENEIAVAKAAVAQSKASLEKAAADRLRMSKVVGTGGVSQRDFEQSVFAEKTAKAQLVAAEALLSKTETGLAVAKKNLSDSEALAPFDGTITRKLKDVGDAGADDVVRKQVREECFDFAMGECLGTQRYGKRDRFAAIGFKVFANIREGHLAVVIDKSSRLASVQIDFERFHSTTSWGVMT